MNQKKTICLDFDGVLHAYSRGWQDGSIYDGPINGALDAVRRLSESFTLVVQTSRKNLEDVVTWLDKHSFPMMAVTNNKPPALVYIDDRGLRFTNWDDTLAFVEKFFTTIEKQVITQADVGPLDTVVSGK